LCDSCHGRIQLSAPVQRGVDAADIKNAVYGWVGVFPPGSSMAQFQGRLSDGDYNDLAAFIAQQVGGGVVATCTSAGVPTANAMATPVTCPNTGGGTTTGTGGTTTGTTSASAASAGAGGCTLGRADQPTDPIWLLLLGAAALVWRRRGIPTKNTA